MIRSIIVILTVVIISACDSGKKTVAADSTPLTKEAITIPDTVILATLNDDEITALGDALANNLDANAHELDTLRLTYDCPQILDKGYLKGFFRNGKLIAIVNGYTNGKFIKSFDSYYMFEDELVRVDNKENKQEFGIGESTATVISTYASYLLKNQKPIICKEKKFSHAVDKEKETADGSEFGPLDCTDNVSIHQKYLLLRSTLLRRDFEQGSCYF